MKNFLLRALFVGAGLFVGGMVQGVVYTGKSKAKKTGDFSVLKKSGRRDLKQRTKKLLDSMQLKEFEAYGNLYGNKAKNLKILESIVQDSAIKKIERVRGVVVAVPEFDGISHEQSLALLRSLGIDLPRRWEQLLESIGDKKAVSTFAQKPSEQFLEKLEALSEEIKNALKGRDLSQIKLSDAIEKFNDKAIQNKWRSMVRSTGKPEDTKTVSNAGGNESVANVAPVKDDELNAIVTVIASYVSKKSFMQRFDAHDKTLLEQPFVPVLVQRMIGEVFAGVDKQDANAIPAGCVLYTAEQAGNLETVAVLNALFGHLEDVVSGEGAGTDQFMVDDKNTIFSVIAEKTTRLVPVAETDTKKSFGLERVKNPESLVRAPTLSDEMIRVVVEVARAVSAVYGLAVDMEIVIDRAAREIWLVQARPVQKAKQGAKPSYIAKLDELKDDNKISVVMVHPASSAVLYIDTASQIIVRTTLDDALKTYLANQNIKDVIKAVIVQKGASPTSHAAAIFRSAGVAILTCDKIDAIKKLLAKDKEIALLIDVQQEKIVNALNEKRLQDKTLEKLFKEKIIVPGRITYPVALEKTVTGEKGYEGPQRQYKEYEGETIQNLLFKLKETDKQAEFSKILDTIMLKLHNFIFDARASIEKEFRGGGTFLWFMIDKLNKVYRDATVVVHNLKRKFGPGSSLGKKFGKERLYAIKPLEALLLQVPREGLVDVFSHSSIQKEVEKARLFIKPMIEWLWLSKRIAESEALLTLAFSGFYYATTQELGDKWLRFLDAISFDKKVGFDQYSEKQLSVVALDPTFEKIMAKVRELKILPAFINVSFAGLAKAVEAWDKNAAESVVKKLAEEFEKSATILEQCSKKLQDIVSFKISAFDDPKDFDKKLQRLQIKVITPVIDQKFFRLLKDQKLPLVAVFAMTEAMKAAVDCVDASIKALKSSTLYPNKEIQVRRFESMIDVYRTMFTAWADLVDDPEIWRRGTRGGLETTTNPREDYLKKIDGFFRKAKSKIVLDPTVQFAPSAGFSVTELIFTAKGYIGYQVPETDEDRFTLVHQLVISELEYIFKSRGITIIFQPKLVTDFKTKFGEYGAYVLENLSGFSFVGDRVVEKYQVPYRDHSGAVTFAYNKEDLLLTLKFFGMGDAANRLRSEATEIYGGMYGVANRWSKALCFLLIAASANNSSIEDYSKNENELVVTIKVTDKSDMDGLHKDINYILGEHDVDGVARIRVPTEMFDKRVARYLAGLKWVSTEKRGVLLSTLLDDILVKGYVCDEQAVDLYKIVSKIFVLLQKDFSFINKYNVFSTPAILAGIIADGDIAGGLDPNVVAKITLESFSQVLYNAFLGNEYLVKRLKKGVVESLVEKMLLIEKDSESLPFWLDSLMRYYPNVIKYDLLTTDGLKKMFATRPLDTAERLKFNKAIESMEKRKKEFLAKK